MSYTTIKKIRDITNNKLTTSLISDAILSEIILQATAKINSLINVDVREEEVRYIDGWRENYFSDGTTTTFYVRNGLTNYLSDRDNDGEVTPADVKVYKLSNKDVRTELTVSSIDVEDGSFTLSEAPGTDTSKLYVWYHFSHYNVSTPDKLVELLATYLSASYAYLYKDHGLSNKVKFGNIEIGRNSGSSSYEKYNSSYMELLKQLLIPASKPKTGQYRSQI
jgi:hypothetical protein